MTIKSSNYLNLEKGQLSKIRIIFSRIIKSKRLMLNVSNETSQDLMVFQFVVREDAVSFYQLNKWRNVNLKLFK